MTTKKTLENIQSSISDCISEIESARDEAQEKFDGKPESWQESEAGMALEARVEDLSDIASTLEDVLTSINTVIETLNGEKK